MTIETIGGSVVPKRMGVVAYDTGWPCLFSSPNPSPGFPPRIGVRGMLSIARMTNWEARRKSCVVRTTMRVTSLLRPHLSRELLTIVSATNVSAWTAHALAWAAGVWLTFGPAYVGVSVTPVLRDESETPVLRGDGFGSEATRVTATLVEVNGLYVIFWLLVPVVLTGIALLAVQLTNNSQARRKILLWGPVVALLGFCAVAILSVGAFYLPAALALLFAAVTDSRGHAANG